MTTVRTTLTKFLKFLEGLEDGTVNNKAYDKIVATLKLSLDRNVLNQMQHEGNVYEIPTKSDLELLINRLNLEKLTILKNILERKGH